MGYIQRKILNLNMAAEIDLLCCAVLRAKVDFLLSHSVVKGFLYLFFLSLAFFLFFSFFHHSASKRIYYCVKFSFLLRKIAVETALIFLVFKKETLSKKLVFELYCNIVNEDVWYS